MNNSRFTFVVLILIMCFWSMPFIAQKHAMVDFLAIDTLVVPSQLKPVKAVVHPLAKQAIAKGERPGEFKNVSYRLAKNVRPIMPSQRNQMSMTADGVLDLSSKPRFVPHPDSVYIDAESDLVFQAAPLNETEMLMFRPKLSAVFDDINLPEQEASVTLANTVSLAQGVVASAMGMGSDYAVNLQFNNTKFQLHNNDEGSLDVVLTGQVVVTNPTVEAKYTKNGGYRLVFKAQEQVGLKVEATMTFKKSQEIPLWGTVIKAGDLGACKVMVALVVDVKGNITLKADIDQGFDIALGAKGGTFYYVPTGISNISTFNQYCDIGYEVKSEMNAFAGILCQANLKFKGYNVLDVYAKGGFEGSVTTQNQTLNADLGVRVKAGGKIVSKGFTVVDSYYSIYKLQIADAQGYKMMVHEACAYGDYVAGEVFDDKGASPKPYVGAVTLTVKHANGQTNQYTAECNGEGLFLARNVPLKQGDEVVVGLPAMAATSKPTQASVPFKEISLLAADYYSGSAYGSVAATKSEWAKLASVNSSSIPQGVGVSAVKVSTPKVVQSQSIQRLADKLTAFKNNLVVYKGPIEFDVKPVSIQPTSAPAIAGQQPTKVGPTVPKVNVDAGKTASNRGNVSGAMGLFQINGLAFAPNQLVRARIEVEGFTIVSDWVPTDGLMVSEIETEGLLFEKGLKGETLSAQNSFVVVSALRSTKAPTGTVALLKGTDAAHASLVAPDVVPTFPSMKKAIVWFDKSVPLTPIAQNPGASLAQTGAWQKAVAYQSPADVIDPSKNQKHPFERVQYLFGNVDLGYAYYIDKCGACTSPKNVVERIGQMSNRFGPSTAPVTQPKPKTPVIAPKTGGVVR
jgi:hypothetical protein